MVNCHLVSRLNRVKLLADEQVADAVGAQYSVVPALMVGLTRADQPKAVEAVFVFGGDESDGVTG
jgi:hypothetical protein